MTGLASTVGNYIGSMGVVPATPGQMGPLQPTGLLGELQKMSLDDAISSGLNLAGASMQLYAGQQAAKGELARSRQEARALNLSAQEDLLAAEEEEIRGRQESNAIMDELLQTVAAQQAAFAANGVDVNFGTPLSVERNTRKLADLQLGITRSDARIRVAARRRQAYARQEEAMNVRAAGRQRADAEMMTAGARAFGTTAELYQRRRTRG